MQNTTAQKKPLDAGQEALIKQLTDTNRELEQFAYAASHELREPLRVIACFTELLAKEYGSKLDEAGRQYMEINRQTAKKMEAMVADLFEYGRIGRIDELPAPTDCNQIFADAQSALADAIKSTKAVVSSGLLPKVTANPLRLLSLFQNLIENSIKFHAPGKSPIVSVSAEEKPDHWQFSVKDNGIGIEAAYLESIFEPFKRLHNDELYAGTGIGLAICKRIVDKLGGRIWAESEPGKGSTFFFTLKKI